jgi:Helix-turn-helix domain
MAAELPTPGALVGRAVRRFRERLGRSQKWVAERMTALGFGWSATTCADVEGTRRRVSVDELIALGAVLKAGPIDFLRSSTDVALGNVVVRKGTYNSELEGVGSFWFDEDSRSIFTSKEALESFRTKGLVESSGPGIPWPPPPSEED